MMKIRRCMAALAVLLSLAGAAPEVGAVELSLPQLEAAPGEKVRVPVHIDVQAGEDVLSGSFDIRYDSSILPPELIEVDRRGTFTAEWILAANPRNVPGETAAGQVLVGAATASKKVPESGVLFYLEVTVAETATIGNITPLSWTSVTLNNGEPVPTTVDGQIIVIPPRINADFIGHPLEGATPLEVRFTDRSSGDIISYLWDFGDGNTSTQANPAHLYEEEGTYTVSLTATGTGSSDTETKEDYIEVTPDRVPPEIIEGPVALSISHNGATILWKTNEPGNSQVEFCSLKFRPVWGSAEEIAEGLALDLDIDRDRVNILLPRGELEHFNEIDQAIPFLPLHCGRITVDELVEDHKVALEKLTPFTFHIYRVRSADEGGNNSGWKGGYFVTRARPDDRPPSIVKGPWATTAPRKALIEWHTNELGDSFVQWALDEDFEEEAQRLRDRDLVRKHQVWLEDLQPDTKYYYRVRSADESGNSSPLKRGHFRTPDIDEAPPVIWKGPTVTQRFPTKVIIEWYTDEASTSRIDYGLSEDYGRFVEEDELIQHHKLLVTNLAPQSFYHYQVTSVDASDNSVSSEDRTFVTEGDEDDDPPRFVHKPHKKQRFHDRVTIGWLMDEEARGSIEFGTT